MSKVFLKKFNQPVSPSASNSYLSLCTVVQAFPLGVLFWVIGQDEIYDVANSAFASNDYGAMPFVAIIKTLFVVLIVALVWHRYATNVYFVAWPLSATDTSAISILASSSDWFVLWMCLIAGVGIMAYSHIVFQLLERSSEVLFLEHFADVDLGVIVYSQVCAYSVDSLVEVFLYFISLGFVYILFMALKPTDETITNHIHYIQRNDHSNVLVQCKYKARKNFQSADFQTTVLSSNQCAGPRSGASDG